MFLKYVCCLLRENFLHQILVIEWLYEWILPASISEIEIESRTVAFAKQTSRRPPNTPRRSLDDYLTRHVSGANRAIGLRCITRCSSAGSCTFLRTLKATQEINWHATHRAPLQALTLVEEFVAEQAAAQADLVRRADVPAIAIRIDRVHLRAVPDDFMGPLRMKFNNSVGH